MIKPLGLRKQKINMCPNFCILCYLENTDLTECKTCGHAHYKLRTSRGRTFVAHRKLKYFPFQPHLDCKCYLCHQRSLST